MSYLNLKTWLVPKPRAKSNDGTQSIKACCSSPAHHLPPEILSEIFLIHKTRSTARYRWRTEALSWTKATQICRHWRKVALNCAELWSTIKVLEPGITEVLLSRSKGAPLTVHLRNLNTDDHTKLLRPVLRQMHRIRSLELDGLLQVALLSSATSRAPILENLVFTAANTYYSCGLPAKFITGGAPRLKHLTIERMNIRQLTLLPLGGSLTHLELRRARTSLDMRKLLPLPLMDLLDSLEKLPLLQHLHISDSLPAEDDSQLPTLSASSRPPISLQALESLQFEEEHITTLTTLLPFVRIPEQTSIELSFRDEVQIMRAINRFVPTLIASWTSENPHKVEEFEVEEKTCWGDDEGSDLSFFFCFNEIFVPSKPRHCVKLSFKKPTSTMRRFIDAFHKHLNFSSLIYFRIRSRNLFTFDDWKHFGQMFENVKAIHFGCVYPSAPMINLFDVMRDSTGRVLYKESKPPPGPIVCPSPLPFPALCALEFDSTHFDQRDMRTVYDDVLSHRLGHALQFRPEGQRVTIVDVRRCKRFDCSDMNFLQRYLPDMKLFWEN